MVGDLQRANLYRGLMLPENYLFCKIECFAAIFMIPVTSKCFPNDWIVRLFETLGLLVEAGQVPLDHGLHPHEGLALGGGLPIGKLKILIEMNHFE